MNNGRARNAIVNSSILALVQLVTVILRFVNQTIFIQTLGKQFLGLNALFSNILSFLAFAELGIGTSIVYSIYKPLADGDEREVSALMNFIRKAYIAIGIVIGLTGLILLPFLPAFIKNSATIDHIQIYFVLYLANSVISYFFTYKRSILIADQHEYISALNQFLFLIIQTIVQILVLFVLHDYAIYLIVAFFATLGSNISISQSVDRSYPYLQKNLNARITKEDRKKIGKNIVGMVGSKIGSIVVRSTDNILLSAYLGLGIVGVYSNYLLIVTSITGILNKLLQSVTSGIGNLVISDNNRKRSMFVFKTHFLLNLFLVTTTATCLAVSFTPFIRAWAGDSYVLPVTVMSVIVINYYIDQIRQTSITFISAYGLFISNGKKSIVEALMNLLLSLILLVVFKLGIVGVLLGTILTDLLLNTWWEPWLIFHRGFHLSGFWKFFGGFYFKNAIFLFSIGTGVSLGILKLDQFLPFGSLVLAIVNSVLAVFVLLPIIVVCYHSHPEFRYLLKLINGFLHRS